tara:strand:+ start:352 stop:663 length:312 start_codon:yes stop_codon:yes gene_type:complete
MREKRWILQEVDGRIHIVNLNCEDGDASTKERVDKTAFEVSRQPGNNLETYSPIIHTREFLAAGVPGHRPIRIHETNKRAIPADHSKRETWGFEDGVIVEVRS